MRLRTLLVASSLLLASACGGPVEPDEQDPAAVTETADASEERTAQWVYCSPYEGQACTPGTRFRCYNQYPTEPGICFCNSSGTYSCG